jgi:RNA recognition motif-containing protein
MLMKHHIATPKSSTPLCPHSELEQQKLEDSVLLESSQEISDHIEESQSRTLFVGDLHRDTVHEDILNLFSSCGEVDIPFLFPFNGVLRFERFD